MAWGGSPDRTTVVGNLARLGFTDPERAGRMLAEDGLAWLRQDDTALRAVAGTADPDLALTGLAWLTRAVPAPEALAGAVRGDPGLRARLFSVLGYSAALADHLARHPGDWSVLASAAGGTQGGDESGRAGSAAGTGDTSGDAGTGGTGSTGFHADLLRAVGADPHAEEPHAGAAGGHARDALRAGYRRQLLRLAAEDLTGAAGMDWIGARLADLASAALGAALAVARAELPDEAGRCRLAIIGMGKCGAGELNYASDVDVIFVAEPAAGLEEHEEEAALRGAHRLAAALVRVCSETTAEGALWPVDAGLRPEGRDGPLVRTLASHVSYYQRWAKTWEFQALLKARPVAGDKELGRAYTAALAPMVWRVAERDNFVTDVQAMRRRVEGNVPPAESGRALKLGPGGLRDVEFAVQLLQLVHGRGDDTVRSPNTLHALEALSRGGYVGRADAGTLAEAYRFLRTLEHRLQLYQLRRTHVLPSDEPSLRRVGRALGLAADPVRDLHEMWRRHTREVRRLHERLFYRPLLLATAKLPADEARLSPQAARTRLQALGYADADAALRHIEALTAGVSRRAAIQRTLLPVLLGWFADAADPDAGLLGFRRVSEALGATPWYLRLLRDEGAAAERMAYLLASSRYVTDLLLRAPEAVALLGDETGLTPRTRDALEAEMLAATGRHEDPEAAVTALRALRRRELVRVAAADLLDLLDVHRVGAALTAITGATLQAGLAAASRAVASRYGCHGEPPVRLALIGMGRLGGGETAYASDADMLFVYESTGQLSEQESARAAHAVAEELRRLLGSAGPDPPLHVDAGLRPEGRDGPLVRTLASYQAYYAQWSSPWERQALLRARQVAGDPALGEAFRAVVDPVRYPDGGVGAAELRQIRRLKARMEEERLPRGADPGTHLKLGRGGLSDVEWVAQLLQLRHAAAVPALRTGGTLAALEGATAAGLLERGDADVLGGAWRMATQLRDAITLVRGRASDTLPSDVRERAAVARVVGYSPDRVGELEEDYRRGARHARGVVERVFFG